MLFPLITQFSAVRFQQYEKTTLIFPVQLERLARARSGTQADCMFKMPFERSLKFVFCWSVHWSASPMLTVRGIFVGKGFCQYNWQSTTAANTCLSQLFLSSNRINIFPNLIKNTPTQLPMGPCWLLPPLSTAARNNSRFMSSVCVVFLPSPKSG